MFILTLGIIITIQLKIIFRSHGSRKVNLVVQVGSIYIIWILSLIAFYTTHILSMSISIIVTNLNAIFRTGERYEWPSRKIRIMSDTNQLGVSDDRKRQSTCRWQGDQSIDRML